MKWLAVVPIDLIYALQFILFIQWYYPKVIIITGCVPPFMYIEHSIALAELITCYILIVCNIRKGLKE